MACVFGTHLSFWHTLGLPKTGQALEYTQHLFSEPIMEYSQGVPQERYQAFEKLCWKQSEDASQKSALNLMLFPIYQGHASDSFSTDPPLVNGGDRGCIVRDMQIMIVLV